MISCTGCAFDKIEMEPDPFDCKESVSYAEEINPIVQVHCSVNGCHVSGFVPGDFSTYEGLKPKAENGHLRLFVVELKLMPPNSSLSEDQRKLIECWINQGALNN